MYVEMCMYECTGCPFPGACARFCLYLFRRRPLPLLLPACQPACLPACLPAVCIHVCPYVCVHACLTRLLKLAEGPEFPMPGCREAANMQTPDKPPPPERLSVYVCSWYVCRVYTHIHVHTDTPLSGMYTHTYPTLVAWCLNFSFPSQVQRPRANWRPRRRQ